MDSFVGKNVAVVQRGSWRYSGLVIAQDSTFLSIFDHKTQRKVLLTVDSIQTIEVID